jgi:hypothetical protein
MNDKLKYLIQRQQALQLEAAAQRQDLSENMHHWHLRLRWLDRTLAVLWFVKRHPASLLGLGTILATLIPNRSGKTLLGIYTVIKLLRKSMRIFASKEPNQ